MRRKMPAYDSELMKHFSPSLAAFIAMFSLHGTAFAQTETGNMAVDTTALSPAAVTGGFSVTPEAAPRALVVLGVQEIAETGAPSVADVLETVPGIDVRSRGAVGITTDLSVRGGTFEQTALWVDGVRWSAPQTGHHLMDLPVDPEDISRIEVFRGGASSALGTGAMTGAVALTAGPSTQDGALLVAETGSNAWMRAKARVDFGTDLNAKTVARHRVSLSRIGTTGFAQNTDASMLRARYAGWLAGDWGSLRTSAGYVGKNFGAQNFYTASFPFQYEETQTLQAQAVYTKAWENTSLEAALHHRTHTDLFQLFREHNDFFTLTDDGFYVMAGDTAGLYAPGASWYAGPNQHVSHTTGGRVAWRLQSDLGETFVSVDSRREFVKSNVLGVDSLGDDDSVYRRADFRFNTDVAVGHRAEVGVFALSATAAWNHNTMFGTRFVPGAELSIDMSGDGSSILFASANRSVRHPSFTDLYYTVGGAFGSRDLTSEWADHLETGVRLSLTKDATYGVQFEQALFQRQGHDLIDWARPNGSDTTFAINLREVTFTGLETVLNITPNQALTGDWQLRYARVGFTTMDASETSAGFESNYVLDGLKTKVDASVGVQGPGAVRLDARWSHQDRLGGYVVPGGEEVEFAPFSLVSFTLSKTFASDQFSTYLRVDNAQDREYVDLGNVQQPGRWLRLGFAYNMK